MKQLAVLLLLAGCATTPLAPSSEEVLLTTSTGTIHGTLLVPAARRAPVALIIAGSGPTDRDGNSKVLPGQNNSLRLLAEGLQAKGIASLRYDKRGIAASKGAMTAEADLRFDHYVADAAAWIRQLRADKRFSTITVIGHSEGSLIGMIAAREARADAYVSIAGLGQSAPDTLRAQLKPQLPPALWDESEKVLAQLIAGQTVAEVSPLLAMLYRPSVQPYLISWFRYEPVKEISRLDVPILIVQGTTDVQVKTDDANALHKAAPRSQLAILTGMNHVLKEVSEPAKQLPSYSDPALPLASGLIDRVSAFIHAVTITPRRAANHGRRAKPRATSSICMYEIS